MKSMTAQEFLHQLTNDPDYQRRRREKEAHLKPIWDARKKDEEKLVEDVNECEYSIESVYDFVNNAPHALLDQKHIGDYSKAYPVLLRHLDIPHEKIIREGIIRSLTVRDGGSEVEGALLRHFGNEKDPDTKWYLANALMVVMPYHRRKKHPEIAHFYKTKTEQGAAANP
jgi:hypothetical protein